MIPGCCSVTVAVALLLTDGAVRAQEEESGISSENLRSTVETLASDEMKGRGNGTAEGRRAAEFVEGAMRDAGLEPAGVEGFLHRFSMRRGQGKKTYDGVNVVGKLAGTDPELGDEQVVIVAHHDHLGTEEGRIYNGADDNASGVAVLLEVARVLARRPDGRRRALVFVTVDCEEDGLLGSRALVDEGVVDAERIVAHVCLDQLGGDFFPWENRRVYALGSECSPELTSWLAELSQEEGRLEVVRAGIALLEPFPGIARSDYANFRKKGVPFVFFSTGTPWQYHTEWDDVERVNFEKMEGIARFLERFLRRIAESPERPRMVRADPLAGADDLRLLREALQRVLDPPVEIRLPGELREKAEGIRERLDEHLKAERFDAEALRTGQKAMILLFQISALQNPH